jgi:hypothetical protein
MRGEEGRSRRWSACSQSGMVAPDMSRNKRDAACVARSNREFTDFSQLAVKAQGFLCIGTRDFPVSPVVGARVPCRITERIQPQPRPTFGLSRLHPGGIVRHRRTGACSLAVLALIVSAAACTSDTGVTAPAKKSPSAPASTRSFLGSPTLAGSAASSSARRCLIGTVTVLYPPADNPLRTACLHIGTTIRITLKSSANCSWATVRSSNPNTVTVLDDHTMPGGTHSASAPAASAGSATLNSADTYTPDRHGPPSRDWRLTLTVVP